MKHPQRHAPASFTMEPGRYYYCRQLPSGTFGPSSASAAFSVPILQHIALLAPPCVSDPRERRMTPKVRSFVDLIISEFG